MSNNEEILNLIGIAKKELEKADQLLNALIKNGNVNINDVNVQTGLDSIKQFLSNSKAIIDWLSE